MQKTGLKVLMARDAALILPAPLIRVTADSLVFRERKIDLYTSDKFLTFC